MKAMTRVRTKMSVAGLVFEHTATPIGVGSGAAAIEADRGAVGVRPPHPAEHLVRCFFRQIAKID